MNLEHSVPLTAETIGAANLTDYFTDDDLVAISGQVYNQYTIDRASRTNWEEKNGAALELAMQVERTKTFPWPNASNVIFPLVTIAALQFHSRAYPALVSGRKVVNCRVLGGDPTGKLYEKSNRISQYMSWQLLEQDENWESDTDTAILLAAICGSVWKKTYYDPGKNHPVSELVLPKDFIINYWAKNTEGCPAKTQVIPLTHNDIYERVQRGLFRNVLNETWYTGDANPDLTTADVQADNREGVARPTNNSLTPFICLEQHTYLDLDGDGYAEPVIVTIEENSKQVLRIVYRFEPEDIERNDDGEVVKINATEYFTKIPFIPSPDKGIYDIGFGFLLGPINESVSTLINQLIDSGTVAVTAGGFLGKGVKMRGGSYDFQPFGWKRVDSTGDDLRKNIVPLPVREPSNVLFQLLNLLIEFANRTSGATDMLTGMNPGQNTPAETSRSMIEQGQKIFSGIFKRIWRAFKQEFRKIYHLNGIYLPLQISFGGDPNYLTAKDFKQSPTAIVPSADPSITSDSTRLTQAQILRQAAMQNPAYNIDAVELRFLEALQIDDIPQIYLGMAHARPIMTPQIMVQNLKNQIAMQKIQFEKLKFIGTMQQQQAFMQAKIINLMAQASLFIEQAGGEKNAAQIAQFTTLIDALKEHSKMLEQAIQTAQQGLNDGQDPNEQQQQPEQPGQSGQSGIPGMAQAPNYEGFNAMGAPETGRTM